MRLCVSGDISRASSRIFPVTHHPRLPDGRLKSRKYKKSAVGGKKSPAVAGTKTAINGEPVSSSNSVGVAFPQPRVAGEARYPG